jgi:hypothetical protein
MTIPAKPATITSATSLPAMRLTGECCRSNFRRAAGRRITLGAIGIIALVALIVWLFGL